MHGYLLKLSDEVFARPVGMPWWWFDALLVWLALMGLLLWCFGRGLVKPLCALLGLMAGSAMGMVLRGLLAPDTMPQLWLLLGALGGATLLVLLHRVSVALALTAVAVAVTPFGVALALSTPHPPLAESLAHTGEELQAAIAQAEVQDIRAALTEAESQALPALSSTLSKAMSNTRTEMGTWWTALGARSQWIMAGAAVGVGLLALVAGLVMPNLSASGLTALIGVLLMSAGIWRLLVAAPETVSRYAPASTQGVVAASISAVLAGMLVQWAIYRRKTPKVPAQPAAQ